MNYSVLILCLISVGLVYSQSTDTEDCGCGKTNPAVLTTQKPIFSLLIDANSELKAYIYEHEYERFTNETDQQSSTNSQKPCQHIQNELLKFVDLEADIKEEQTRVIGDLINQYVASKQMGFQQLDDCVSVSYQLIKDP